LKRGARFVLGFAAVGAAVAVLSSIAASSFEKNLPVPADIVSEKLMLTVFPAAFGGMDTVNFSYWSPVFFELVGINAVLYALLGFITWLGVTRHKAFFILEALIILELWRRIIFLQ
jgi:hypothetical protein